jgi:hypothetical protein
MIENKLFSLLKTLNIEEFHWFEKYVKSSFFNHKTDVIKLIESLKKYHPTYLSKNLTEEKLYQKVYPTEKYENKQLRYLMSDTSKLLEEFLAYIEYENESAYKTSLLLRSLNKRNLDKYFISKQKMEGEKIVSQKDAAFYFQQHILNATTHSFVRKVQNRGIDESLQNMNDNLDRYYLSTKLKYCCEILNRQNILSSTYEISMLDEILLHLNKKPYEHIPAISIYYNILLTLTDSENEIHFFELKKTLTQNHSSFSKNELRDMYAFAQNYCIKRINLGKTIFLEELFQIYQTLLKTEILLTDGILSQWDYKNITAVGLRLNQREWIESFIDNYKVKLMGDEQENAYQYNKAYLAFYNKDYSQVLKRLQQVEFTDIYYQLDSKNLLVKTYYEKEDIDALLSAIHSFSSFIRKHKLISEYQRSAYLNFLILVDKLNKVLIMEKVNWNKLKNEIENTKPLADVTWLIKKHEEKENKYKFR